MRTRQRAMFFSATEAPEDSADALTFLGQRFSRGTGFSVATKAKQSDLEGNLRWIGEAKRQADFVIFSLHNHEYGAAGALKPAIDRTFALDDIVDALRWVDDGHARGKVLVVPGSVAPTAPA